MAAVAVQKRWPIINNKGVSFKETFVWRDTILLQLTSNALCGGIQFRYDCCLYRLRTVRQPFQLGYFYNFSSRVCPHVNAVLSGFYQMIAVSSPKPWLFIFFYSRLIILAWNEMVRSRFYFMENIINLCFLILTCVFQVRSEENLVENLKQIHIVSRYLEVIVICLFESNF